MTPLDVTPLARGARSDAAALARTAALEAVIGIGTDLVDVERIRRALDRTPGFASRVFTEAEREAVASRRNPVPGLAARFAAKEAVLKSLGLGIFSFPIRQIEVVTADSGEPSIRLHDAAAGAAELVDASRFLVSLTHTDSVAHAMVIAVRG